MNTRRLLFLGSKTAGLMALRRLPERLPEGCIPAILCPNARQYSRTEYENFQALASRYGLPLHLVKSGKVTADLIRHYKPQTVLVHGWYRMIPIGKFPDIARGIGRRPPLPEGSL